MLNRNNRYCSFSAKNVQLFQTSGSLKDEKKTEKIFLYKSAAVVDRTGEDWKELDKIRRTGQDRAVKNWTDLKNLKKPMPRDAAM